MNSKNLFTVNAIINFLFAIPLLAVPALFLSQYMIEGDQLGHAGLAVSKAYGGLILALGIALWMGRNSLRGSLARKILLWFVLIGNVGNLIAYLPSALSGALTPLIYTTVGLTAILAIWSAILLFKKSES